MALPARTHNLIFWNMRLLLLFGTKLWEEQGCKASFYESVLLTREKDIMILFICQKKG